MNPLTQEVFDLINENGGNIALVNFSLKVSFEKYASVYHTEFLNFVKENNNKNFFVKRRFNKNSFMVYYFDGEIVSYFNHDEKFDSIKIIKKVEKASFKNLKTQLEFTFN